MTPIQIHFAHANGFPAGSYKQMYKALPKHVEVIAKPAFAESEHFDADRNWHTLVDELIHYCEAHKKADTPLWAVGHSMGSIVSYKACCERPDLFSGLIMLDPPLVTGALVPVLKYAKKSDLIDRITPASMSSVRKSHWQHDEDIVAYFKSKALFKPMLTECIEDYVSAGLVSTASGKTLRIKPKTEAQLFRNVPDDLSKFAGKLVCPGYLVTGHDSKVCRPIMYKRFVRKNHLKHRVAAGGHMFPLEHPAATARLIMQIMNA